VSKLLLLALVLMFVGGCGLSPFSEPVAYNGVRIWKNPRALETDRIEKKYGLMLIFEIRPPYKMQEQPYSDPEQEGRIYKIRRDNEWLANGGIRDN
jgi:hypothetical protein